MTEALPGLKHLDRLAFVEQLHRSGEEYPEPRRGKAIFDEHSLPRSIRELGCVRSQRSPSLWVERVKRRVMGEECVQVLHAVLHNCVRIATVTHPGEVAAYPGV